MINFQLMAITALELLLLIKLIGCDTGQCGKLPALQFATSLEQSRPTD